MPTPSEINQYRRDGFFVARALLSPVEAATIGRAFTELAKDGPVPGLSETSASAGYAPADPLSRYPRMMHPHRHDDLPVGPITRRLMLDRRIQSILLDLMAEEPVAVQSMFYFKPPGARGQDLHQDNYYLRVKPGTCMAAWIAIDDADEENGGLVVVPGTAAMDIVCPDKADPARFFTTEHVSIPPGLTDQTVNLKAGDCLFFNGSLIHGSYPNTSTDRFRRALIFHYVPAASAELSHWYSDPLRFDGTSAVIAAATGGGPCGTTRTAVTSPH